MKVIEYINHMLYIIISQYKDKGNIIKEDIKFLFYISQYKTTDYFPLYH